MVSKEGKVMSANFGNRNRWTKPPMAFSDFLMAGEEHHYSPRCSVVLMADLHQILRHGGIYFYPEGDKRPNGKLRLLDERAPLAMLAEQSGGGCITGKHRVMKISSEDIHQRIPFAIGSLYEIEKCEKTYRESGLY